MNLNEMISALRKELKDPAGERWTDEELRRHIERALREVSLFSPLEAYETLEVQGGGVELGDSGEVVGVEAVEYPVGENPPSFIPFKFWGGRITFDEEIPDGEVVGVFLLKVHRITPEGSTLPPPLEELVLKGASAYASLEWSIYSIERTDISQDAWSHFLEWGKERLYDFREGLLRARRRRVRAFTLRNKRDPQSPPL